MIFALQTRLTLMHLCGVVFLLAVTAVLPLARGTEWCPQLCTCYRQLTTTDCSGRHLISIPNVPNVTCNLYLENNHIEHLMGHAFAATPHLVVLTLHGNLLTLLDSSTFEGLLKLQELNLSRNQLILLKVSRTAGATGVANTNGTLPALLDLDLSGNHFRIVPHNISLFAPHLKVLNLSHNTITSAWLDPTYNKFSQLQKIDLTGNPLHQIASFHFDSIRHGGPLQVLRLSDCAILFINETSFSGLGNLTSLTLSHNPINTTLLANALNGFGNDSLLAFLDLSSNLIPHVNSDLLQPFSKLMILDLSNSTTESFDPDLFSFLPSLHTLELQDNRIAHVGNLSALSRLRRLNLRNNQLTALRLAQLSSLEFVDLSHNFLAELPAKWISFIDGLRILNLSHNRLSHISPHAFHHVTLNHLDLSYNQLTILHCFGSHIATSMLVLAHNKIHTILDDAFTDLEQTLEDLDLSYNSLSQFPDHHIGDFMSLQRLNLAGNDLGHALRAGKNGHLFYSLRHLQVFDLSHCNVTALPHEHVRHLHHLTTLDLHGNKLLHLGDICLPDLASLAKLDVSHNQLRSVDTAALSELQFLEVVDLSANPFQCSCDLVDLVQWINSTPVSVLGMEDHRQYSCVVPHTQRTRYIMTYHPSHKECINRHHNIRQDLTLFGIIVAAVVGATVLTAFIVHYGKVCHRLKSLHYRWQIRYREVSGTEISSDPKL